MKRLFTFILVAATFAMAVACQPKEDEVVLVAEYLGTIETTQTEDPFGYSGFNIDIGLYSDNTCLLRTAVVLADKYTLDAVKYLTCYYKNMTNNGFNIVDGNDNLVATANFSGPATYPEAEILLNWVTPICTEWTAFADIYGWEKPCRMTQYYH
jgi:hypothetical protein